VPVGLDVLDLGNHQFGKLMAQSQTSVAHLAKDNRYAVEICKKALPLRHGFTTAILIFGIRGTAAFNARLV
jgi:hypothetical protein